MREMKDSGIEWIKQIPTNWDTLKGKNVLTLLKRPIQDDMGVITCFRDGEVTLRSNRREEGFTFADKEIGSLSDAIAIGLPHPNPSLHIFYNQFQFFHRLVRHHLQYRKKHYWGRTSSADKYLVVQHTFP